jgi:hypothetical protein
MTENLIDQVREAQAIYDGPGLNARTEGLHRMQTIAVQMAAHILATEERLRAAEAHNDRLTSIRSQAIKEFCANAGLKPSEQARGLPDDVRDFRMQAALHALKEGQEDG